MTNHPLSYIRADLQLRVATMCKHLRHKAFTTPESEQGGMIMLIESQMMADEVGHFIHHHESTEKALEHYLKGESFADYLEGELPETIYQYCLHYFEGAECPLGSSTDMLSQWVDSYAERHQAMTQAYERIYGHQMDIHVPTDQGNVEVREANEEEKFNHKSTNYLRLIEQGYVLSEYNSRMLEIHTMLLAEKPVSAILRHLQES